MHDLLEEMGKEIVRKESPTDAGRRSRLWFHEDVYQVLTDNTGTTQVKGIRVELPTEDVEICLGVKCFKKMVNLKIFININARFSGKIRYFPNQLRFLDWCNFPLESFPSDFNPQKLVLLNITNSKISRLVQGSKVYSALFFFHCFLLRVYLFKLKFDLSLSLLPIFKNLKDMKFDGCEFLTEFPVFPGMFPNVESLRFAHCSNLVEFPRIVHMKSLECLHLNECKRLENFLEIGGRMESLRRIEISGVAIKQIPASVGYELVNLELLSVYRCDKLTTFPRSIYGLQHLKELYASVCLKMTLLEEKIPTLATSKENSLDNYYGDSSEPESNDDQGNLSVPCVFVIILANTAIVSLPVCIRKFVWLRDLFLNGCTRLEEISELPPNLRYLYVGGCTRLQEIQELPPNLKTLDVSGCVSLKRIVKLWNILKREESQMLEELNLSGCETLWANLVDEAEKQGWPVNGQVAADVVSLFLLSQQSAFWVIFPASEVIPKWFGWEMGYPQGSDAVEFDIEILPNFNWENTGLAFSIAPGDGKGFWGFQFLQMYINEVEVKAPASDYLFYYISPGEVGLYYVPFKGIDTSKFGQIPPLPPFQCRVRIVSGFQIPIESCGVHLVMPPKKDMCMKLIPRTRKSIPPVRHSL